MAPDIKGTRKLEARSAFMQKKWLVSQAFLESLQLDEELGAGMLQLYRKGLANMRHPNTDTFKTLDEYLVFRRRDIGVK
jgi:hypothetical protein